MRKEKHRKRALDAVKQPILQIAPGSSLVGDMFPYRLRLPSSLLNIPAPI
jgi:hypothetical protein